jgi:hypothetical protein
MINENTVQEIIAKKGGTAQYKSPGGSITQVTLAQAGIGHKKLRIRNLAPEVPNSTLLQAIRPYGVVEDIQSEKWTRTYRYQFDNGIRVVSISFKKHVPSSMTVVGQRKMIAYEGQPTTCFGCGEEGQLFQACSHRRRHTRPTETPMRKTYADCRLHRERGARAGLRSNGLYK